MSGVLTHFPKSRLSELAGNFGGMSRDDAVAAATSELDKMRPESDKVIIAAIAEMEALTAIKSENAISVMRALLPLADRIVTLAGTYNYAALDKATKSLCDLLDGLITSGRNDLASVKVHIQTMRMLAPGSALPPTHVEVMLNELKRLLDHHGVVPPPPEGADTLDAFLDSAH